MVWIRESFKERLTKMRVHITSIYGQSPRSIALISQKLVKDVGRQLGYDEMGIYFYNDHAETHGERSTRMDGIIAGLGRGDIVVFQVPTWNSTEFDELFLDKLQAYGARIITFVHDIVPLMFESNFYLLDRVIDMYNRSDVVILPTKAMHDYLIEKGMTTSKVLYQEVWDHPVNIDLPRPECQKVLSFAGDIQRFPFVNDWKENIPLIYYGDGSRLNSEANVHTQGWKDDVELMLSLSKRGGFGLCWSEDREELVERRYSRMNASYKLSTFLAAGLPIIANHDISSRDFIKQHGLGFTVETLEEAVEKINNMEKETYDSYVENVEKIATLLRNGYITKKLLIDAVHMLYR